MNKKNTLKKTAALMLGLALTVGATGCNFIVTDSQRDLAQTVATVNITDALKEDERYGEVIANTVDNIIGTSEISKRDLITYFLNAGSSYVDSYGYEYTFNMLLDTLINREIIIQYAVAYYLSQKDENGAYIYTQEKHDTFVDAQLNAAASDEKAKELLEAHPEVLTFKYFLTEGGAEMEEYYRAEYSLKKSLNSSLDSLETGFIKTSDHEHDEEAETRTLPTGVGTEKADYYTQNYQIYTGRNSLAECGDYEAQEGSTTTTRRNAYNSLLSNLNAYGLISTKDGKVENPSDIYHLDYYYVELTSTLTQALINKYYEDVEADVEEKMNKVVDSVTGKTYVETKYDALLEEQKRAYENKSSDFKTAMDGVSDSSFLLYGTKDFGYVYNILIPFSVEQEIEYAMYKAQGLTTNDLYLKRKELWSEIKAEDQRSTWISDDEHLDYSYVKDGKYFFFEDNTTNAEKYEALNLYAGVYPFQGSVEKVDDELKIKAETNKSVDDVLEDMLRLIEDATGIVSGRNENVKQAYLAETEYTTDAKKDADGNEVKDEKDNVIMEDDDVVEDYEKFIYYSGKVDFGAGYKTSDHFNPESASYKALAAVNEIMFAYSTDPGCLNSYMGYVVSPNGNGYVPEFEAAAQWAVSNGVGSWAVVPTDYGWHIIYCSFAYSENGEVYEYNHEDAVGEKAEEKATFSYLFYNSLKEKMVSNTMNEEQAIVLNQFNNNKTVKKYQKAYQDLLDMQ